VYNLEINWEIGEVRITRCPPLCNQTPEKKVIKKKQITVEDEKDLRWNMEEKERREKIMDDHKKVEELVL